MKKNILLVTLACLFTLGGFTQNCTSYYYLQNNKTVEISIYNKKGDVTGRQVYTVSDVSTSGGTTKGTVNSEMFDKKGKSAAKAKGVMQCKGGVIMIDMKMSLPAAQQEQFGNTDAKADNLYIEYPASMNIGDALKDASMDLDITTSGMQQSIKVNTTNRKVEGKESITTPAGTWECFKISYKSKMVIKTVGIGIPVNIEGTEWYAPGFGVVKTESKHGTTLLTSIK
jgi:hypothetical protein